MTLQQTISPHDFTLYQGQKIPLYKQEGFEGMRKAGRIAARTLDFITPYVKPGVSTGKIDQLCHDFMISHGAIPATLGYKGYTKSCCTSVNHVVCHGIPSDEKILKEGDIINIDVTAIVDGWYGDTSRMFAVGKISILAQKLIDVTYQAFSEAISIVKPGITLGDIGYTIQKIAESNRFSVVRDFCGHGLGQSFHTAPEVLHFGSPGEGLVLQEGMFFTIEPMINAGHYAVKILSDGWTAVTRDKSLSAQFEHSIGVTATGHEIFTLSE